MKKLAWSALLGSAPVCALYWIGRLGHSSGPPSSFSVYTTMFFLMPGYYFLGAVGIPISESRISQQIAVTLTLVFDCMFWSLAVLLFWGLIEEVRGAASGDERT